MAQGWAAPSPVSGGHEHQHKSFHHEVADGDKFKTETSKQAAPTTAQPQARMIRVA